MLVRLVWAAQSRHGPGAGGAWIKSQHCPNSTLITPSLASWGLGLHCYTITERCDTILLTWYTGWHPPGSVWAGESRLHFSPVVVLTHHSPPSVPSSPSHLKSARLRSSHSDREKWFPSQWPLPDPVTCWDSCLVCSWLFVSNSRLRAWSCICTLCFTMAKFSRDLSQWCFISTSRFPPLLVITVTPLLPRLMFAAWPCVCARVVQSAGRGCDTSVSPQGQTPTQLLYHVYFV